MEVFFKGLYAKYSAANTLKTALYVSAEFPGFYLDKAPQLAPFPYCVVRLVSGRPEYTFTETAENFLIQFSLFSENSSSSEVLSLFSKLISLFDYATLSVTGYTSVFIKRERYNFFDDLTRGVWQAIIDYEAEIQA